MTQLLLHLSLQMIFHFFKHIKIEKNLEIWYLGPK